MINSRRVWVHLLILGVMFGVLALAPPAQANFVALECTPDINQPHSTGFDDGLGCRSTGKGTEYCCQCQSCCQTYCFVLL